MAKRLLASLLVLILMIGTVLGTIGCGDETYTPGDGHEHVWTEATCTEAKKCTLCGLTDGMPNGHTGGTATCTAQSVCTVCGLPYGALGTHNYVDHVCNVCGADETQTLPPTSTYTYTAFTSAEKGLFTNYFGLIVPFIPNNDYYVEDYSDENGAFLFYYTYGNTQAEFDAYREAYAAYTYLDEDTIDGFPWYSYRSGDVLIDLSYYITVDNVARLDVYVYPADDTTSGSGNGGNTSGGGTSGENLPTGTNGVYNVNFTDAVHVKDVTDQGCYLDGCPTTGSPDVLIIPVDFSDRNATTLGYQTSVIEEAFKKNGVTDYYSVYDYYNLSSYGQLTLDITVLDFWFRPQYASTYYENKTETIDGYQMAIGDQVILDEALAYLDGTLGMDLSQFDSDGNGIIDAVVLINTLEIDSDKDFHWAYRYWNYYTDKDGYYYEYDGVSANDYLWASYQFLHETYDAEGYPKYDDTTAMNTYTFIHEFGHVLGVDDYYDTTGDGSPMGGCDVMDSMTGDHNAFSKFNLGWVTSSRLVTTDTSVTLKLRDFSESGDTIILANNWDATLGAYQEYYIIAYYKSTGLNGTVNGIDYGYFLRDGIVVYHVNAALINETIDGTTYYDVGNNNSTPDGEYGTEDNLIEYVLSADDSYTYIVGDTLPATTDDNGNRLSYTFRVDQLDTAEATLTFTKIS